MSSNETAAIVIDELGPDRSRGEKLAAARRLAADVRRAAPAACDTCRQSHAGVCPLEEPERWDGMN